MLESRFIFAILFLIFLKKPMLGTLLLHYEKSRHFAFEQVGTCPRPQKSMATTGPPPQGRCIMFTQV